MLSSLSLRKGTLAWSAPPWYQNNYASQWDYQRRYVYLKMPDSFHTDSNEVWQPQRIFYSRKQVFHVRNKMLDSTLMELEFGRCSKAGCHPRGACSTPSLSAVNSAFLQPLKSDPREIEWHPLDGIFQQRTSGSFYSNTYSCHVRLASFFVSMSRTQFLAEKGC